MRYQEHETQGFISHFITCFWEYNNLDTKKETEYTIIPDGYFDLICEIGDDGQLINIFLTGIWTQPVNTQIKKNTKLYGIRFKLLAAEYIFEKSISDILNTTSYLPIDFLDIQNAPLSSLDIFAHYLIRKCNIRLKGIKEFDTRKLNLFNLIYKNQGHVTVKDISENVFWSSRQINRYFNQQYGFSLKRYLNIVKCHASYPEIANGQLFPANNYYDQAHFIKDIKKYTGVTPKELYHNKNDRFLQLSTRDRS